VCGSATRIIARIEDSEVIEKILSQLETKGPEPVKHRFASLPGFASDGIV